MPANSHVLGDHLSLFKVCIILTVSDSLQHHGLWPARLLCPWEFSRQEYFSGLPFHLPGDLPDPGTEPASPVSPTLAGDSLPLEPPGKPQYFIGTNKTVVYNESALDLIICISGLNECPILTDTPSVQFTHSVMSDSFRTHGRQHAKPLCPSPTPRAYSNSCPLSR